MANPLQEAWQSGWPLLAGVVVFVHGYARFNTPPTSRSSTTFSRFHTGAFLYGGALTLAWGVLTALPHGVVVGLVGHFPKELDGVTLPFVTALVLTTLLPSFPGVQAFDTRVRACFQNLARIGGEAEGLTRRLASTRLIAGEQLTAAVFHDFAKRGLSRDDVVFQTGPGVRSIWTRITAVKLEIEGWAEGGDFQRFFASNSSDIRSVLAHYDALQELARKRLTQIKRLENLPADKTLAEVVEQLERPDAAVADGAGRMRRPYELLLAIEGLDRQRPIREVIADLNDTFREETRTLHRELLQIVARSVLDLGRSLRSRRELLCSLGFQDCSMRSSRLFDQLTGLSLLLILLYFARMTLLPVRGNPPPAMQERALLGLVIGFLYAVAVFAAVYPKRWEFFQARSGRPIRAYAVSGLIAACIWVCSFLALWMTLTGDLDSALTYFRTRWPWALMTVSTAFVTAWTVDNRAGKRMRIVEALGQGLASAIVGLAVALILRNMDEHAHSADYWQDPVALVRLLGMSVLTGTLIGWCVPTWYRESRRVETAPEETSTTIEPVPVALGEPHRA